MTGVTSGAGTAYPSGAPEFTRQLWIVNSWYRRLQSWSKKSLKIPKGQSESAYRRTDNTMAKRKSTKGHNGSFPHSRLIIGFVTRLKWRVSPVEQELLTLPEHLRSHPVFSGVRVTRALIFCICFVDVMNEERTGKCLQQVEHIRGHGWLNVSWMIKCSWSKI
jgi:hypothetical protein